MLSRLFQIEISESREELEKVLRHATTASSGSDLERLKKRLQEPSGIQSYGQIQKWLKSELGL
ncbi:hypothetical protein [Nostoc sp. T09]|uniref:hypothetical protein n=1 Tax=Nostoc sp. T09 TaxID=1932621 RepID=UPI0015C4F06E|nr:hypothetical protein [Nostoc sp. T09]